MVATVVLAFFSVLIFVVLVRSLVTGRIDFGTGAGGLSASRQSQPASFWSIFCIELGILALFVWLVVAV